MTEIVIATPGEVAGPAGSEVPPRDRNPYWVYLGRFSSKNSRETMAYALRSIAAVLMGAQPYDPAGKPIESVDASTIAWWLLRYQHVERIKSVLLENHKPATVNKLLSALRQVLDCSRKLELMTADQCAIASDVSNVKFSALPAGRGAPPEEIGTLLLSMKTDRPIEMRDWFAVGLTYLAGLRRSEISWLTMDRYRESERTLRVLGKGNKERDVPIVAPLQSMLDRWLSVRGREPGALVCLSNKEGRLLVECAVSPQTVYSIVSDAAVAAGIAHLSPHDLRRSMITNGLEAGMDALVVSKIVGHEQLQTTLRYDRRDEKVRREQMDKAFGKDPFE